MERVVISNPKFFESLKEKIIAAGVSKFHVIADFDRTLTRAFVNGEKTPSIISILRDNNYISPEYVAGARSLSDKYHPIEMDHSISDEEKSKSMHEWWSKHFDLLIKSGLNKTHIQQVVDSGKIQFREGVLEFFDFLHEKGIPLVILSSAGLGGDSIRMVLERENKTHHNIHVISNEFKWDSDGKITGYKEPIIHLMNKKEVTLEKLPIYNELLDRKNVLLLGDSLSDIDMVEGFHYDNLIKIGFLSYNVEESLDNYKKVYDVIILNDGTFNYVNALVKEIGK